MSTATQQIGIDVAAIEHELAELWRTSGANNGTATTTGNVDTTPPGGVTTRVCALNLIVVSTPNASGDMSALTAELAATFPTRTIIIEYAPDQPDHLSAAVQAVCALPAPGQPQVCCEQITIQVAGKAEVHVPGTVLALLVADVPTMLWWAAGDPFDASFFRRLAPLAERLIIDSRTFTNPHIGLRRVGQLLGGNPRVSDLGWGRLTPWRELIAQFFDAPTMTPHLAALRQVMVRYANRNGVYDQIEPLLFVGWLGSRLGLALAGAAEDVDGQTTVLLRRATGGGLTARLVPVPIPRAPTDILEVELRCANARFNVALAAQAGYARARAEVDGMGALERIVPLDLPRPAALVGAELQLLGRDKGYEAALIEVLRV